MILNISTAWFIGRYDPDPVFSNSDWQHLDPAQKNGPDQPPWSLGCNYLAAIVTGTCVCRRARPTELKEPDKEIDPPKPASRTLRPISPAMSAKENAALCARILLDEDSSDKEEEEDVRNGTSTIPSSKRSSGTTAKTLQDSGKIHHICVQIIWGIFSFKSPSAKRYRDRNLELAISGIIG